MYGQRTGWNTRGGTAREHVEVMREQSQNPDSHYWANKAQVAFEQLQEMLGWESYQLWYEITFPMDTITGYTWKDIYEITQGAINAGRDNTLSLLECYCFSYGDPCLVCQAQERIRDGSATD